MRNLPHIRCHCAPRLYHCDGRCCRCLQQSCSILELAKNKTCKVGTGKIRGPATVKVETRYLGVCKKVRDTQDLLVLVRTPQGLLPVVKNTEDVVSANMVLRNKYPDTEPGLKLRQTANVSAGEANTQRKKNKKARNPKGQKKEKVRHDSRKLPHRVHKKENMQDSQESKKSICTKTEAASTLQQGVKKNGKAKKNKSKEKKSG